MKITYGISGHPRNTFYYRLPISNFLMAIGLIFMPANTEQKTYIYIFYSKVIIWTKMKTT